MLPGMEVMACPELAVSKEVMRHVVQVESSRNPYAIGVVGGRLQRQPKTLDEALATARMLEEKGFNFSVGIAQVNRYNLKKYGLDSYARAFQVCPNLQAGSRILAECYERYQDWGKSFSCYYSGNPVTGFRHGYVQKVFASMAKSGEGATATIPVTSSGPRKVQPVVHFPAQSAPSRVVPGVSRVSTNAPASLSHVPVDPAFAGSVETQSPVPIALLEREATTLMPQPPEINALGALGDTTAELTRTAGPVRLQATAAPTATKSISEATPLPASHADGAFVF